MNTCPALGHYDNDGEYVCPIGYQVVAAGGVLCCQPLVIQQGDDGVYGDLLIPEVVISGHPVTDDTMPPKPKTWLQNNWYWIVMPMSVAFSIWLWKKYGQKLKLKKK